MTAGECERGAWSHREREEGGEESSLVVSGDLGQHPLQDDDKLGKKSRQQDPSRRRRSFSLRRAVSRRRLRYSKGEASETTRGRHESAAFNSKVSANQATI